METLKIHRKGIIKSPYVNDPKEFSNLLTKGINEK
jgi:hypothetical protein